MSQLIRSASADRELKSIIGLALALVFFTQALFSDCLAFGLGQTLARLPPKYRHDLTGLDVEHNMDSVKLNCPACVITCDLMSMLDCLAYFEVADAAFATAPLSMEGE